MGLILLLRGVEIGVGIRKREKIIILCARGIIWVGIVRIRIVGIVFGIGLGVVLPG